MRKKREFNHGEIKTKKEVSVYIYLNMNMMKNMIEGRIIIITRNCV